MTTNGKMQWERLLDDQRFGVPTMKTEPMAQQRRSDFERDYDRMIFSAPFRRLQNKAQIFPLPEKVFVHNRLTHSLEVSCVGRSLGNHVSLRLAEKYPDCTHIHWHAIASIVSAACLAHDMGNPPFGHSGERAIRAYFTDGNGEQWRSIVEQEGKSWNDFAYYEGNANAFRLLTHQFEGRRPGGFALTHATLASMIKYPWNSIPAGDKHGKFGFFEAETQSYLTIAESCGLLPVKGGEKVQQHVRHPLVYLVEAADDICYQIMDIEDAYKLKIVSFNETSDLLIAFINSDEQQATLEMFDTLTDRNEQIAYLRSKAINRLTIAAAELFIKQEERILQGLFEGTLISNLPEPLNSAYRKCSHCARSRVYNAKEVVNVELAGHRIFAELIDRLMHSMLHPDEAYSQTLLSLVSSQYDVAAPTTYGKILSTLDYISGMTDVYALDLYRRITGMSLPAI